MAARTHISLAGTLRERDGANLRITRDSEDLTQSLALWDTPGVQTPCPDHELRLNTLRGWQREGWPDTFTLINDALILRNGRVATSADLKPGDRIALRTRAAWDRPEPRPVDMVFAFGP